MSSLCIFTSFAIVFFFYSYFSKCVKKIVTIFQNSNKYWWAFVFLGKLPLSSERADSD